MKLLRILLRASALAVLTGLLGAGMAAAQSEGPSLGELARKKKKDDKKSTHVYSDENLPKAGADFGGSSSTGASSAPASAAGATSTAPAAAGAAAPTAAGGEEAKAGESSPDLEAAKQKVETAKNDEATAEKNIKKLEDQMASETSEFRRETYRQALENAQGALAEFKRKREEAEKEEAAAEAAGKKKKKKKPAAPAAEEAPQ